MFKAIADGFGYLYSLLIRLGSWLLEGLGKLLAPVLEFLGAIFYFLYKIGVVLAKVLHIVYAIAKLLIGLIQGLFSTLIGFSYTGRAATLPSSYQKVFTELQPTFQTLQLDKVAYLFQFGIWLFTAFMAIRIIGNMRGPGGD